MMNGADIATTDEEPRKPTAVMRTLTAALHTDKSIEDRILNAATYVGSYAVQSILSATKRYLQLQKDDAGLMIVDLELPLIHRDSKRAIRNTAKERRRASPNAGPKSKSRPQYKNSYRMEEITTRDGKEYGVFRIAERFSWETRGGTRSEIDHIPALYLQQVIMSWMRPYQLDDCPAPLRPGICQQAAQQLLSHIGLLAYGKMPQVAYPTLEERRPEVRLQQWRDALARISRKIDPFEYAQARELFPWRYDADDPRGDRSIIKDPDWLEFIHSPFPKPFPLNFVASAAVVLYERTWQEILKNGKSRINRRVYAALPLFDSIPPENPLGILAQEYDFWWRERLNEFRPLGAWHGMALDPQKSLVLIPLDYDADQERRQSRFRSMLEGRGGRKVNWSLAVKRYYRRGEKQCSRWELHVVTSREITPVPNPFVLGVHFAVIPIIFWALTDRSGNILEVGRIDGNPILSQTIAEKLYLEKEQKQLRWVGNRVFGDQLKQRTLTVCREILALAAAKNASIALEKIIWVDKRTGDTDTNQRFSLWNYGQLAKHIKWLGLERSDAQGHGSVEVIREVSDYILRYTCPQCGACRAGGAPPERSATVRTGDVLTCRRCGFSGAVPDDHQARLVARLGAERLS